MTQDPEKIIRSFPTSIAHGIFSGRHAAAQSHRFKPKKISRVIICGMGGSALPGAVLSDALKNRTVTRRYPELMLHRDYGLPRTKEGDLVVAISYSGNTEETISSFKAAHTKRLPLVAIASGGSLERLASQNSVPFVQLAPDFPHTLARFAVGQQLGVLTALLSRWNLLPDTLLKELEISARKVRPQKLRAPARALAKKLSGKIPVFYSSERFYSLGYIWKIQMNENAKILAFSNVFPEINHNEMNAYAILSQSQHSYRKPFAGIFLSSKDDMPQIRNRATITQDIMRRAGVATFSIKLYGPTFFDSMLTGILLGAYTSTSLAASLGIDPLQIQLIEEFKKRLKK